jgi:hypothetical protein
MQTRAGTGTIIMTWQFFTLFVPSSLRFFTSFSRYYICFTSKVDNKFIISRKYSFILCFRMANNIGGSINPRIAQLARDVT